VKRLLDVHRNQTNDPLPDDTPHTESKLSWKVIAKIALKGDLKGRRTMFYNKGPEVGRH
jgi:hypothetical protein